MKTLLKSCALAIFLLPVGFTAYASDDKPDKGMMMGEMTEQQMEEKALKKQKHMLKMHDLSDRILAETDDNKKQALMKEQRELMKKAMKAKREKMREHHKKMMKKMKQ